VPLILGLVFLLTRTSVPFGFIDQWGFAYSNEGRPANVDGNDSYRHLDGGWWRWTDRF
jgi:hypothetical protein